MKNITITIGVDRQKFGEMRAKIPAMVDGAASDRFHEIGKELSALNGRCIAPLGAQTTAMIAAAMHDEAEARRIGKEFAAAFSDAADTLAEFSDALKAVYKLKSRRRGLPLERGPRGRRLKDGKNVDA